MHFLFCHVCSFSASHVKSCQGIIPRPQSYSLDGSQSPAVRSCVRSLCSDAVGQVTRKDISLLVMGYHEKCKQGHHISLSHPTTDRSGPSQTLFPLQRLKLCSQCRGQAIPSESRPPHFKLGGPQQSE